VTTPRGQSHSEPRGPIEQIGAAKERRNMARRLAEAVGHALNAAGVTLIVTVPDSVKGQVATFSTYGFVTWGAVLNALAREDVEEFMLHHLKATENQFPQHRGQVELEVSMARQARQMQREMDQEAGEAAVDELEVAVEEHHDTSEGYEPESTQA
jgi:capsid portal protein